LQNTPPPNVAGSSNFTSGAPSAIAAQFAAQVAATLKLETQDSAASPNIAQQSNMSSQIPTPAIQMEKPPGELANEIPHKPMNVQNTNVTTGETDSEDVSQELSRMEPLSDSEISIKTETNTNDVVVCQTSEYTQSLSNTDTSQQKQESATSAEVSTAKMVEQQANIELSDSSSVLGGGDNSSSSVVIPEEKARSESPSIQTPTEPQSEEESISVSDSVSNPKVEARTTKEPSPESATIQSDISKPETKSSEIVPETKMAAEDTVVPAIKEIILEQGSTSSESSNADNVGKKMIFNALMSDCSL